MTRPIGGTWRPTVVVLALLAVMLWPSPAHAETNYTVIHLPALLADNRCSGEPVVLSGDLHIVTATNPTPDGGTTVRAVAVSEGLEGTGAATGVVYQALDAELSSVNYVPPPGNTFLNVHSTLLVPEGDAPVLLVVVLKGTVADDGSAITTLERTYLACRPRSPTAPGSATTS